MLINYVENLEISESSKKVYNSALKRLLKLTKSEDIKVIYDKDRVLESIKDIVLKSKQIMYTAIVSYLKSNDKDNADLLKFYRKYTSDTQHALTKLRYKQQMNPTKIKNLIELKDLKKISKMITTDMKYIKTNTKDYLKLFQHKLIINLYMSIHARLDFADMKIISHLNYEKLSDIDKSKTNYLIKNKNKYVFQFNKFKNVKAFGKVSIIPNLTIVRLLNKWLNINPTKHLLITLTYTPMSRNNLSGVLKKIFLKYLGLQNASLNSMRHGMISDECKNRVPIIERNQNARQYFHSDFEHEMYRNI